MGIVEGVLDSYGQEPQDDETEPLLVTVGFPDGDETFRDTDLRVFSKPAFLFGYIRKNWKNGAKEMGAGFFVFIVVSVVFLVFSYRNTPPKPEETRTVDPIVQIGQLKADAEVKRSEALASQRDLKKQLEASYDEVAGYDSQIQGFDKRIMELVNPKDSRIEVKKLTK